MGEHEGVTGGRRRTRPTPLAPLPASGLPPKGDPRRPVLLAVRSMRLLCVLLFLAAGVMAWQTFRQGLRHVTVPALLWNVGVYAVPAVAYLVCIFGVLERRAGAVVFGLVVAGVHLLGACALFAILAVSVTTGVVRLAEPAAVVGFVIAGLWVVAIAQLVWHLALSLKGIRYDMAGHADGDAAGFDVGPPR